MNENLVFTLSHKHVERLKIEQFFIDSSTMNNYNNVVKIFGENLNSAQNITMIKKNIVSIVDGNIREHTNFTYEIDVD
jgi:hypothetical protein